MWQKSDFDFEFQRLNEDIELLKTWLQERRHSDLEQGLERLTRIVERLDEKVGERLSGPVVPPLEFEGLLGDESPNLSGMMLFPGDEGKDAMPIPPSMLAALFTQLFDQDGDSANGNNEKGGTPRFEWPGPSDN